MFNPRNFETPCPDNAHGTPLENAEPSRNDTPSGNPATSTAPDWQPGAPSLLGSVASSDELASHAVTGPGMSAGRLVCCAALRRAEHAAPEVDAVVLRGLRHAIAAGALSDADAREDELCELGAAASIVLEQWDAAREMGDEIDRVRFLMRAMGDAVELLREQHERIFGVARG